MLGQPHQRERPQHRRVGLLVGGEPGGLRGGPGLAQVAGGRGLGGGEAGAALGLGVGPDPVGDGLVLGLALGVGALLGDQLLLPPGELDLIGELVLGDAALVLDGDGAPFEGGPVGLLLDEFPGGGAQGAFHLGFGAQGDHADGDDGESGLGEPGFGGEAGGHPLADAGDAVGQGGGERGAGEQAERVLLGGLGEQGGELVERGGAPGAGVGVDAEVDAGGGGGRVGDPVGQGALDGDVLEVGGAGVEEHREFAVVDRHLGEGGGERAEPEGEPGAVVGELAAADVPDVGGRAGAQVAQSEALGDVGHGDSFSSH